MEAPIEEAGRGGRGGVRGGGRGGGRVSNGDRQRLIRAHESNEDVVQLARQMCINIDTARSIIRV